MEQLVNSLLVFWTSILYGFWIEGAYQCLLGIRTILPRHRFFYWIEDLVFWPAAGLLTFQMYFKMCFGNIRGYGIIGLLSGMLISYFTLGLLLKSISGKIRQIYLNAKRKINIRRRKRREARREKREKKRTEREEKRKEKEQEKQKSKFIKEQERRNEK